MPVARQTWFGAPGGGAPAAGPGVRQQAAGYGLSTAASITLNFASAVAAGGELVVFLLTIASTVPAVPAGWSEVNVVTVAQPGEPASNNCNMVILSRTAQAGDGAAFTFALPGGSASGYGALVIGYEVSGASAPASSSVNSTTGGSTVSTASIDAGVGDLWIGAVWNFSAYSVSGLPTMNSGASSPTVGWLSAYALSGGYGAAGAAAIISPGGPTSGNWSYHPINSVNPGAVAGAVLLAAK